MKLSANALRLIIPAASLAFLLAAVFYMQPRAMSYTGMNLLFNLAVPIALATIAQMLIMSVNDLDLSMGTFVSFCACVTATFLQTTPLLGITIFAGAIAVSAPASPRPSCKRRHSSVLRSLPGRSRFMHCSAPSSISAPCPPSSSRSA